MERLVSNGHRRIALALPRSDLNLRHIMIDSYRRNIQRLGIEIDEDLLIHTDPGDNGGVKLVHDLIAMPQKPTAVIYSDHILPFGIYRGLADLGLTPGRDLSIIGVGTRLASLLTPNLTHYRFNLFDLGVRIADALLARLDVPEGSSSAQVVRESVSFSLIEGESIQELP